MPLSKHNRYLLVVLCALIVGCKSNNATHQQGSIVPQIIQEDKGGDFRGIRIGDKPEQVEKEESGTAVYSMPDELVYRFIPQGTDSTWYEISYNFNESGLYDIQLEVIASQQSSLDKLLSQFTAYYDKKYGQQDQAGWHIMTSNARFVNITIQDSLTKLDKPCLKINFYESSRRPQ